MIQYIQARQNEDGGYSFAQGAESSAADTYYAVQILTMLGAEPRDVADTIRFMTGLQHEDGGFDSINVAYYVASTLNELGEKPQKSLEGFLLSLQRPTGAFGSLEADIESPSEFEATFYSLRLLRLLGRAFPADNARQLLLSLQNDDGSFGRSGYSRLGSTYHALASLGLIGFDARALHHTLEWVRSCEIPSGGFRGSPDSVDPYIVMDGIYYGVLCLEVYSANFRYPSQTLDLIGRFQNENGGFRRSVFLGISTFESTYQAIAASLTVLSKCE